MSPDSKYISLIMYTTKLKIDLCNFPAIWAVLSMLLDTKSNELQYVKKFTTGSQRLLLKASYKSHEKTGTTNL